MRPKLVSILMLLLILIVPKLSSAATNVPSQPQGLFVTDVGLNKISLSWRQNDPMDEVQQYRIYINDANIGSTADTSYTIDNLEKNRTYKIYITAVNNMGESTGSTSVYAKTLGDKPSAPEGLILKQARDYIKITWQPNPLDQGVTGYNIYKDGNKIASTATNSYDIYSYDIYGITPGEYDFYVTAINQAGESNPSSIVHYSSIGANTPSNLKTANISDTRISIIWEGNANKYNIYVNDTIIDTTSQTQYIIENLAPDNYYTIYVTAIGINGSETEPSNVISVKTMPASEPMSMESLINITWPYIRVIGPFIGIAFAIGAVFMISDGTIKIFRDMRY